MFSADRVEPRASDTVRSMRFGDCDASLKSTLPREQKALLQGFGRSHVINNSNAHMDSEGSNFTTQRDSMNVKNEKKRKSFQNE